MISKAVFSVLVLIFIVGGGVGANLAVVALATSSAEAQKPLIVVFVEASIFEDVRASLEGYVADLEGEGYLVDAISTVQLPDDTPAGIRAYLQQNQERGLVGSFIVGDVAIAWYEVGTRKFPTDLYYMDLDGVWTDADGDGAYDTHTGDVAPEIYVGRLKTPANSSDQVALINNYFDKNHRYREGSLSVPWWRALVYVDDDGIKQAHQAEYALGRLATDVTYVIDPYTTNATDYKDRLKDPLGFQWVYLMVHGSYSNHTFKVPIEPSVSQWDGTVYSSDYSVIDPRVLFYHFVVCSAARYSESDYLAGEAVFAKNYGLLALGSTDYSFDMFPLGDFYGSLSERRVIGASFREWLLIASGKKNSSEGDLFPKGDSFQILYHSMVIVGDPTLQVRLENHDVAITDLSVSVENVTGDPALRVSVTAENQGEFSETFSVSVTYDFRTVLFSFEVTLEPGERANLTFVPMESAKLILATFSQHTVVAEATVLDGEFDAADNTRTAFFEGIVIKVASPPVLPEIFVALFLNGAFIGGVFVLFKGLTLERLPWPKNAMKNVKHSLRRFFGKART